MKLWGPYLIKGIIFDFFDVIHQDPLRAWLTEIGLERKGGYDEAANALDLGQIDYRQFLERLSQYSGYEAKFIHKRFEFHAKVDKDVVEVIKKLRSKHYIHCLLSNAHAEEIRPLLIRHKLLPHFDHLVISGEVGLIKPDPQIFKLALQRVGLRPEETAFIDDNLQNILAAKKLGITGIHHTNTESLYQKLRTAGIRIE